MIYLMSFFWKGKITENYLFGVCSVVMFPWSWRQFSQESNFAPQWAILEIDIEKKCSVKSKIKNMFEIHFLRYIRLMVYYCADRQNYLWSVIPFFLIKYN